MKRNKPAVSVSSSIVYLIIVLQNQNIKGSPFPQFPQFQYPSWLFSGPGMQQLLQLQSQHQQQNEQMQMQMQQMTRTNNLPSVTTGNSNNRNNCNHHHESQFFPCSGYTKETCSSYCGSIGYSRGECQGGCCLCYLDQQSSLYNQQPSFNLPKTSDLPTPNLPNSNSPTSNNNDDLQVAESSHQHHQFYDKNKLLQIPELKSYKKPLPTTKKPFKKVKPNKICTTPSCYKASKILLSNTNLSSNPCQNFYNFACGGFLKSTPIPPQEVEVTPFSTLRNKVSTQLNDLFKEDISPNDPAPFKLVKTFYKSCMDVDTLNKLDKFPIVETLNQMGSWPVLNKGHYYSPTLFTWSNYVVWLAELGFSHDIFLRISVEQDVKDVKDRKLTINEPILSLPKEVLVKGLSNPSVSLYYNYMVNTAVYFGAEQSTAEKEMLKALNFEILLAQAFHRPEKRGSTYYLPIRVKDLSLKYPSVPWLELFQRLFPPTVGISEDEIIILQCPHYLDKFLQLINTTEPATFGNYAIWRAVSSSMTYLGEPAREIQFTYNSAVSGQKVRLPRSKECTDIVAASMGNAAGSMYIRRYFPPGSKTEVVAMIGNIRNSFLQLLEQVDWMDAHTKFKAKEKAGSMSVHVGYPDEHLRNDGLNELYKDYDFKQGDYYGNVRNLIKAANWGSFGKLHLPVERNEWVLHGKNAAVNAFYMPLENSIQFPAGILQLPFFDPDRPRYLNYGAIGWVIGHEITHGFDDQGHQFDKDGNHADWWDPLTKKTYHSKTHCMVKQYGSYHSKGHQLNGANSLGENIADNGGLKQAYKAYQSWIAQNSEEMTLPGFEKFSPNQLFWISAAANWCSVTREERLKSNILSGVHSPGEWRVRGSFSNSKDFAKDWNCVEGVDEMHPKDKCMVW